MQIKLTVNNKNNELGRFQLTLTAFFLELIIYKFLATWHVVFLNSRARASARASARARVRAFDRDSESRFLQHCMPRLYCE